MKEDCDICGGSGKIRLPVRERLSPTTGRIKPKFMPIREYSCPECGVQIPSEKVLIVQAEEIVETGIEDPEYLVSIKNHIASRLARFCAENGCITFEKIPLPDQESYRYRTAHALRGKIGVVSPRAVATFEQRVRQHQEVVAKAVVEEATKGIRLWGSHGVPREEIELRPISKRDAIREMYEALNKIITLTP